MPRLLEGMDVKPAFIPFAFRPQGMHLCQLLHILAALDSGSERNRLFFGLHQNLLHRDHLYGNEQFRVLLVVPTGLLAIDKDVGDRGPSNGHQQEGLLPAVGPLKDLFLSIEPGAAGCLQEQGAGHEHLFGEPEHLVLLLF